MQQCSMQYLVLPSNAGVVNGVHESLCNLLDLLKCVLVILLPHPEHFGFLAILSFASVACG